MMRNDAINITTAKAPRRPLVIGCGALAHELVELTRRAGLPAMDLTCLPASLHNRPERIPGAVAARIRKAREQGYDQIFVAYADCGTGGLLDSVLDAEGIARLEGAHCYEVYAGRAAFASLHDAEPGTFYLTDFLVRNFERLVVRGLGLDRHPELLPVYFGNYRRLVYLAQADDAGLTALAIAAAERLGGLAFERRLSGLGELGPSIAAFAGLERDSQTPTEPEARPDIPVEAATGPVRVLQTRITTEGPDSRVQAPLFVSPTHESVRKEAVRGVRRSTNVEIVSIRHGRCARALRARRAADLSPRRSTTVSA